MPGFITVSAATTTTSLLSSSYLPKGIRTQCRETDQPAAALVLDLKARGLLNETLVVWGGEFGRTSYSQGKRTESE